MTLACINSAIGVIAIIMRPPVIVVDRKGIGRRQRYTRRSVSRPFRCSKVNVTPPLPLPFHSHVSPSRKILAISINFACVRSRTKKRQEVESGITVIRRSLIIVDKKPRGNTRSRYIFRALPPCSQRVRARNVHFSFQIRYL